MLKVRRQVSPHPLHLYLQISKYKLLDGLVSPPRPLASLPLCKPAMGFSTNLQGKSAHEALLSRQDAELRLLDSMKRCILSKVRCDRDYAVALGSVATQGLKIDRGDDLHGSLVAATWKTMMEELDNTGKLIKQNADTIESKVVEALNGLYAEKRKMRKVYQEEHTRILQQFTHVSAKTYTFTHTQTVRGY